MALDVERPAQGQAAQVDAAAQASQQPPVDPIADLQGQMAQTVQDSAQQVQAQQAGASDPAAPQAPSAPLAQRAPLVQGIMQAPAIMQQPMRTQYERDQEVKLMWDVVARDKGSALTQQMSTLLSGVD